MKKIVLMLLVPLVFACKKSPHEANIATVKQYVQSVESLDYVAMESLLAENYEGYGPSAGDTIRREAAVESWKKSVEELYDKIHYSRSQYAGITIPDGPNQGNWVANWAELQIDYKDGESATIWVNTNYQIDNGKIVKTFTFYNEADVLEQLGYVFIDPDNL
jgi:hypothetical protein